MVKIISLSRLLILTSCIAFTGCGNAAINRTLNPYREAVKQNPADARAQYDLGSASLAVERYKEARKALTECLELDSSNLEARLKLAQALDNLQEPILASRCIREVIEIDSCHIEANEKLGERNLNLVFVFEAIGQNEEINSYSGLTPSQFKLLNMNDLTLEIFESLYQETEMIWNRLIRLEPDNPYNWCGLGAIKNQQEDYLASKTAYREALKMQLNFLLERPVHSSIYLSSRESKKWIAPQPTWLIFIIG